MAKLEKWMVEYLRDGLSPKHVPVRPFMDVEGVLTHTIVQAHIADAIEEALEQEAIEGKDESEAE